MKGIILAGGSGTRLWPVTQGTSKQLLPVFDKPMVYYPLSTLMSAGIREILIVSTPQDLPRFKYLLGSGEQWGCNFTYKVQDAPRGLADAFIVGRDFIGSDPVAMVLGDNIFHGSNLGDQLKAYTDPEGGIVFAYEVSDPERYGVVEFGPDMKALSIVEKPTQPKSHYAVPGLYFYNNSVVDIAASIQPSARGELEITAVNSAYLKAGMLNVHVLDRGSAWFDTGTFMSLKDAADYVAVVQTRQGLTIGCPEELAWRNGWISDEDLLALAAPLKKSGYGEYLERVCKHSRR